MYHNLPEDLVLQSKIYTIEGLIKIIDTLPLTIAIIDKNSSVVLANRSTYEFTNKNKDQLIGLVVGKAFGCIHHEDVPEGCGFGPDCLKCKLRETVYNTLEKKEFHRMVETTMVFKNRGERHLRFSTIPMVLGVGEVVLLAVEDISARKKHHQMLVEKEKLSAVIQTAGAICHEINQPLMTILGYAELLLEDTSDETFNAESLGEIKDQAERLGRITAKLMKITKYRTKNYLNKDIIDIEESSEDE